MFIPPVAEIINSRFCYIPGGRHFFLPKAFFRVNTSETGEALA